MSKKYTLTHGLLLIGAMLPINLVGIAFILSSLFGLAISPIVGLMLAALKFSAALILGASINSLLIKFKQSFAQPISKNLPAHQDKAGTPTLGGLAIFLPYFLLFVFESASINKVRIDLMILPVFLVGLMDDVKKIISKNNRGLPKLLKLILLAIWIFLNTLMWASTSANFQLTTTHLLKATLDTSIILSFIAGYGVTDGLDGLLGSISLCVLTTLTIIAALAPSFMPNSVISWALLGSLSAFLSYNWKPAKIFMGDCGALALGALIGGMYVKSNYNPVFLFLSAVPMINLISVGLKIGLYKIGVRYNIMAPLHHEIEIDLGELRTVWLLLGITAVISLGSVVYASRVPEAKKALSQQA